MVEFSELKKLAANLVKGEKLSSDEIRAVVSFLEVNVSQVQRLLPAGSSVNANREILENIVRSAVLVNITAKFSSLAKGNDESTASMIVTLDGSASVGAPRQAVHRRASFSAALNKHRYRGQTLYTRGSSSEYCTLILNGKVTVMSGRDEFEIEMGPWSVLGADALVEPKNAYVPDFSAFVASEDFRCLKISVPKSLVIIDNKL